MNFMLLETSKTRRSYETFCSQDIFSLNQWQFNFKWWWFFTPSQFFLVFGTFLIFVLFVNNLESIQLTLKIKRQKNNLQNFRILM